MFPNETIVTQNEIQIILSKLAEARNAAVKKYKNNASKHVKESLLIQLSMAAKIGNLNLFNALVAGNQKELKDYGVIDRSIDGKAIVLHSTGEVAVRTTYLNNERVGICSFFTPTGEVASVIEYSPEGKLLSQQHFSSSGDVLDVIHFDENEKKSGLCRKTYVPHTLKVEDSVACEFEYQCLNDLQHGPLVGYYINEKKVKKVEATFLKGKLHGDFREWYPNGVVKTIAHYKNGKLDGKRTSFDIRTRELVVSNHKAGLRHGEYIYYSPDMKTVKFQANYSNGLLNGEVKVWYYPDNALCSLLFEKGVPQIFQ